jgi:hypothetical protein
VVAEVFRQSRQSLVPLGLVVESRAAVAVAAVVAIAIVVEVVALGLADVEGLGSDEVAVVVVKHVASAAMVDVEKVAEVETLNAVPQPGVLVVAVRVVGSLVAATNGAHPCTAPSGARVLVVEGKDMVLPVEDHHVPYPVHLEGCR